MPREQPTVNVPGLPVSLGDVVAFTEDHDDHAGHYGIVEDVLVEGGEVKLELRVFHPAVGAALKKGTKPKLARVTMGEIQ